MDVHVEATGRRIAPFDDPVGDVPIANRPLSAWQDEMLAGFTRVDAVRPPCLVVPDTLFTTPEVLQRFVESAAGRDAVLVLAESLHGEGTTAVQPGVERVEGGWRFSRVRFVATGADPVDVVIDPEEERFTLPLAAVFGGPVELGLPRHPILTLHHWAHILWANQAAGSLEVRRIPRWRGILRVIWAVIRARSVDKWRVLAKLNTIGKGCDIHPTAVIEGSTLGDGVTVGPFARIVFSRIGDGATIMTGAEVEASTVGERATVAQRSAVRMCVLYPEAFASQVLMQACVLGRRVLTTPGSFSIDLNLEGDIRVPLDGQLHSAGTRYLGSAFGHDARVGTGIWLASGRAIPNRALVVKEPTEVVQRIPVEAGDKPLVNRSGTLVPLER